MQDPPHQNKTIKSWGFHVVQVIYAFGPGFGSHNTGLNADVIPLNTLKT